MKEYFYDVPGTGGMINQGIIIAPKSINSFLYGSDKYAFFDSTESSTGIKPYLEIKTYVLDGSKFLIKVRAAEADLYGFKIYLYPPKEPNDDQFCIGPFMTDNHGMCYIDLNNDITEATHAGNYEYTDGDNFGINIFRSGYATYYTPTEVTPPSSVLVIRNITKKPVSPVFSKPLDGNITSSISGDQHFGWRYTEEREIHNGSDISAGYYYNATISSVSSGTVVEVDYRVDSEGRGEGYMVQIAYPDDEEPEYYFTYMHMTEQVFVSEGETVLEGHDIGKMGYSGLSDINATHLHFTVDTDPYYGSTNLDPFMFIDGTYVD